MRQSIYTTQIYDIKISNYVQKNLPLSKKCGLYV